MNIELLRYYENDEVAKSLVSVDGTPFCEAREAWNAVGVRELLPAGVYTCRCFASEYSPMTLKVCRPRGKSLLCIGWNALRQWKTGLICLGYADSLIPEEERKLIRQQEAFDAFTQKVYAAYVNGETFSLEIKS